MRRTRSPERPRYPWRKMVKADHFEPPTEAYIAGLMKHAGISREEALRIADEEIRNVEVWVNDLYQVQVTPITEALVQLNIRRRDGRPIMRDWRHFQQIKNDIVGPECEAVELYPAESRLVDTSNKYHLWAVRDPSYMFPIGFAERDVQYEDTPDVPGMRQRPL